MNPTIAVMSARVILIHADAPPKPAEGRPCNGCGVCCASEPCPIGQWIGSTRRGGCRALRWNHEDLRYRCGLVEAPKDFWPWLPDPLLPLAAWFVKRRIAASMGCDSDATVERA